MNSDQIVLKSKNYMYAVYTAFTVFSVTATFLLTSKIHIFEYSLSWETGVILPLVLFSIVETLRILLYKIVHLTIYEDRLEAKSMFGARSVTMYFDHHLKWEHIKYDESPKTERLLILKDRDNKVELSFKTFGDTFFEIKNILKEQGDEEYFQAALISQPKLILAVIVTTLCIGIIIYLKFYHTYHFTEDNTIPLKVELSHKPYVGRSEEIVFYTAENDRRMLCTYPNLNDTIANILTTYPFYDGSKFIAYVDKQTYNQASGRGPDQETRYWLVGLRSDMASDSADHWILPLDTMNGQVKPQKFYTHFLLGLGALLSSGYCKGNKTKKDPVRSA